MVQGQTTKMRAMYMASSWLVEISGEATIMPAESLVKRSVEHATCVNPGPWYEPLSS